MKIFNIVKHLFFLFALSLIPFVGFSQILSTAWKTASSTDIVNNTAIGNEVWNNPGNAATDDNSYATISNPALLIGGTSRTSNFLKLKNFNFDIPEGYEIKGIGVEIRRFCSDNSGSTNWTRDFDIRLLKDDIAVGTNHAVTGVNWPTSETSLVYGSNSDLWSVALSREDVNNSDFGVMISIESRAAGLLLPTVVSYIDQVRVMVYYELSSTLPVSLMNYKLNLHTSYVNLNWQTISEHNNKEFLIYRRGQDGDFAKIGTVLGNGNSDIKREYSFNDKTPTKGTNYYKLVQVDYNGKETEIGVKSINYSFVNDYSNVSFDDVSGKVSVNFPSGKYTRLSLVNITGKTLANYTIESYDENKQLDFQGYQNGVYIVKLAGKDDFKALKFIKR